MRKLTVFNNISLDGYFTAADGDMNWARGEGDDPEYAAFVDENAHSDSQLLLGRITYAMITRYWLSPMALQDEPVQTERMNSRAKVVFSRTLAETPWCNTAIVKDDLIGAVKRMKNESGPDLTILGSGSIVVQLAQVGLIDEYTLLVTPVVLGAGRTMFSGLTERLALLLQSSRTFNNGITVLSYRRHDDQF